MVQIIKYSLVLTIAIYSCRDNKKYYSVNDEIAISLDRCIYCKDSLYTNMKYQTILLTKEKNTNEGIKILEDTSLYNFHLECSERLNFSEGLKIYNSRIHKFQNLSELGKNSIIRCSDCGQVLKDKSYYGVETRIEKNINNIINVDDAVIHVMLCESCKKHYNFNKIQVLIK